MNREEAGYLAKVMQAFADGKEVQYRAYPTKECSWWTAVSPDFNQDHEWRIKPEPKRTVGYRQYYFYSDNNEIMFSTYWEDCDPRNIQRAENSEHFIKWKHTEWQYDDVEVE